MVGLISYYFVCFIKYRIAILGKFSLKIYNINVSGATGCPETLYFIRKVHLKVNVFETPCTGLATKDGAAVFCTSQKTAAKCTALSTLLGYP
jgi:hypothetical protein